MTWGEWQRTALADASGKVFGTSSILQRKRGDEVQYMTAEHANALEACAEALKAFVAAHEYDPYEAKKDVPLRSSYGDRICGCTWNSGPYTEWCPEHDPEEKLDQAYKQAVTVLAWPTSEAAK